MQLNFNIPIGSFLPGFSFPSLAEELFFSRACYLELWPMLCTIARANPCSSTPISAINAAICVC